jgi:hypothetical protein
MKRKLGIKDDDEDLINQKVREHLAYCSIPDINARIAKEEARSTDYETHRRSTFSYPSQTPAFRRLAVAGRCAGR